MITKNNILHAQKKWSDAIVNISIHRDDDDLRAKYARSFIEDLYAFNEMSVLFKPTKVKSDPFRFTKEKALSYFVAGENKICKEDDGFALHPWKKIIFENANYIIEGDIALAMGNYYFTDSNQDDLKIEYTFGYKLIHGKLKIFLHHSSFPYKNFNYKMRV